MATGTTGGLSVYLCNTDILALQPGRMQSQGWRGMLFRNPEMS